MKMIKERVAQLRELMKEHQLDAYIIPSFDAHQGEYVADYWKSREWISGFTGSAGTVVITLDDAGLWTDGRYYIQAEKQLAGSGIRLFRMADPEVPFYTEWLADVLKEQATIGFDGRVFSTQLVERMKKDTAAKQMKIHAKDDLIDQLWYDRPAVSDAPAYIHDVKYAGKSRTEKLAEVRVEMKKHQATHYLVASLDDIAWLLNIRGTDVPNNPVVTANVLITDTNCTIFIDSKKLPQDVKEVLEADGIEVKEYEETTATLEKLPTDAVMLYDDQRINYALDEAIPTAVKRIAKTDVTTTLKAIKNDVEIENFKACELRDGVAMVRFIKWLKEEVASGNITEIAAEQKLEDFRREQADFVEPSFDTIAAYKENAAMMHYKAEEATQKTLEAQGLFLVDSGGQYYDGTTDITRTIALGALTDEEKHHFTLVLQGFIALSKVKFLQGSTGGNLDVLARQPIWAEGIDYKCGTGHGVGFFLNVHEGPQSIRNSNHVVLEKGMILTNEPGIYLEGKHGIRTENMLVVVEAEKTEFGQFMAFDTITYCPIDVDAIEVELLTQAEKQWLNAYHEEVYAKLSPYLNEEERAWLKHETRAI